MEATLTFLQTMYRETYEALAPASAVEEVAPYWSHIYQQIRTLDECQALLDAGDVHDAQTLLASAVDSYNAGVGGDAQARLMLANAAGKLDHVPGAFAQLEGNFFVRHQLPTPAEPESPGL